ncbi:aminoglycoside 3'-phosphotransferase [Streptomyces sp. MJP52]|uniref:aminoglycoside 3'-phosphotransferase n=1 Tax=Streptomyces sp. MJP52 TaxID=2940555 RepID=UPI00247719F8|nr:aminoglycoside 3'-phosphotransferase [Streptomyces sp. MJP52]MDH6227851.1 aminoglycoside phosphotransferase [Streptomyces sp. MJP52]
MVAAPPEGPVDPPPAVLALAGGRPVRAVWRNLLGGLTFRIGADGTDDVPRFAKWAPAGSGLDLAAEAVRLRWAARYTVVPPVLAEGADASGAWLLTGGLAGTSAVDERWKADSLTAVRAIGAGLRALHEALPVADCPFDWSAERRLARVRARVAAGDVDPAAWPGELRHLGTVARAVRLLERPPPVDRLVVCHGDACAPNTLVGDDGGPAGHVDLGALGVADRWADLAVATWSTGWNYGPGWEEPLLDAYGVAADPERTAYYRALWELTG